MFRVTKELAFCFGHRLMDYPGKCRQLHGHNARLAVTVAADRLDPTGMVADFAALRRTVGEWLDRTLDHKLVLHEDDPLLPVLRQAGDPAVALADHPTTENLARFIFDQVERMGFPVVEVTLWETPTSAATYTKDGGACRVHEDGK